MEREFAVKAKGVIKSYDNSHALDGIDLEVRSGQVLGLIGPNGAGKSTTINSITSLVKPSNGSIEIFGKNIEEDFRFARSKVGIAHQEVSQDLFFPIEQLLYFQAGFYGILRKDSKERIEYLLNKLGLFKHKSKKMRELSGGMKRRLQIAKALVHDPDIIILDEPTAGVDVELRHDLWSYLQELHSEGKTILLTTHYIDEAELLCEKVGIIDKGKLIVEDSVDNLKKMVKNSSIEIQLKDILERKPQFLNDYEHNIDDKKIHIITDKPNMELPSIILKFSEKAIKIEDIHIPQTSLEDVFLDLTGRKIND